jgi:hypothetical protein
MRESHPVWLTIGAALTAVGGAVVAGFVVAQATTTNGFSVWSHGWFIVGFGAICVGLFILSVVAIDVAWMHFKRSPDPLEGEVGETEWLPTRMAERLPRPKGVGEVDFLAARPATQAVAAALLKEDKEHERRRLSEAAQRCHTEIGINQQRMADALDSGTHWAFRYSTEWFPDGDPLLVRPEVHERVAAAHNVLHKWNDRDLRGTAIAPELRSQFMEDLAVLQRAKDELKNLIDKLAGGTS